MRIFPRGAEWRKWDLHLHAPGTKFNDGYGSSPDWDSYCQTIEESDVAVIGITDYFSLQSYYVTVAEHRARYPDSEKLFIPNLELRLNESVNKSKELVHIHVLFRPELKRVRIDNFLSKLAVQRTEDDGRKLFCNELESKADFASATVSRADLQKAIKEVFGDPGHAQDNVLLFVAANNDGIRAEDGARRKQIADEIERQCQGLFGNEGNRDYFLDPNRYENAASVAPAKPVFAGSDAHSLKDLESWLGKTVTADGKVTTWVKADPTFEGLQQTLIEPAERVRLQAAQPDSKEPYKVITAVRFSGRPNCFPSEIVFNQNLVSVIGSRSSGKSALLAYIAHAIDRDETLQRQSDVAPLEKPEQLGPAAGISWQAVEDITCSVEWGSSGEQTGHVIYIPQNWLFSISGRADQITAKIRPAIYRLDPSFQSAHSRTTAEVDAANEAVRSATEAWFDATEQVTAARKALRELGDRAAIVDTQSKLAEDISAKRAASSLTEEESAAYQKLVDRFSAIEVRLRTIEDETARLAPYLNKPPDGMYELSSTVRVEVHTTPNVSGLPASIMAGVRAEISKAEGSLTTVLETLLRDHQTALDTERQSLIADQAQLRADNSALIAKNAENAEIEDLVKKKQREDAALEAIERQEDVIEGLVKEQGTQIDKIGAELARRDAALKQLKATFAESDHLLDLMRFGLEQEFAPEVLDELAMRFDKRERGPFVDRDAKRIEIEKAQSEPAAFLKALDTREQKAIRTESRSQLAVDVLTTFPETRFFAEMEGDRIGGFRPSSMTPGKQALFALTLILNESDDAWPLLIDQPEDDLDSRSIYKTLVSYLMERKRERQIIMVSHDANLVIGADSEQVVVANRHGVDRKNKDEQEFAYLSGSLDHSQAKNNSPYVLTSCGVREHACELLDGGEEAFRKRRDKYKL